MTQVLRRPAASLIPLLALLLAMLSPAAAFAESDNDEGGNASADMHCDDHSAVTKITGTQTIDDVTITVSGPTVSVEGGSVDLCVKAATDNSGRRALTDGAAYTVDFTNNGGQTPNISYVAVYSVTPTPAPAPEVCEWDDTLTADDDDCVEPNQADGGEGDDDNGDTELLDVALNVDDSVCEEVTYVLDGSGSTNVDAITVTGTIYLGGTEYHTETHTLDAANGWTKTIVGAPAPNTYTLEWTATAGDLTDSGTTEFTVEDCTGTGDSGDDAGDQEVLDVTVTVDDSVCDEVTYVVDGSGSTNVDAITVTGTLYLGGTFYHEESHTLDASNDWTKTIVGQPGPFTYTLEWTATAGDLTDSGTTEFTVEDCNVVGDGDGDDEGDGDEVEADHEWADNVDICHRTRSATNPYRAISPSLASIVQAGHGGHEGPIFDAETMTNGDTWGDIIPSFTYLDNEGELQSYDGLNWPAGEDVLADGCAFGDGEAANPAIDIDKSATESVTLTDEDDTVDVTYTYVITNTGNITLDITEFGDDRIAALDLDAVEDTTLEPGEHTSVTWTATLGYDDFDEDGNHTNVATVTGVIEGGDATDTDDTVSDDDDHTVTVEIDDDGTVGGDVTLDLDITAGAGEICLGDEVVITVVNGSETDVTITGLLTLPGGATMPVVYEVDAESTTTFNDTPVLEGTHTIEWYASAEDYDAATGTLSFEVVDCDDVTIPGPGDGGTPDVPVDEDEVTPTLAVDYQLVCPDGVAGLIVDATGTDFDVTTGEVNIAFVGNAVPFWTYDVTLGEELALLWPIDDGLLLEQFDIWVSIAGVDSDVVTLDTEALGDCDDVLGEVIDQPDTDDGTPDDDNVVDGDDTVDEVVREETDEVADDDDDTVMGVVTDADSDAVAGESLAYTGGSVLALLAAGLFSLLTGAGLLRRRS